AQLVDTDTESDPKEAPSEVEELQSVGFKVPLMGEDFESMGTRTDSSHSSDSSNSTTPLSPDHLLTHVSPTPTPTQVSFHRRTARMARYRSSYETSSSSPTLPGRKRYRGDEDHGLGDESQGLEDEGLGFEEEEVVPGGQSSRSVLEQEGVERISAFRQPTLVTWVDPEDDRVYIDIPAYAPPAAPVQTLSSPKWSLGSLPVSPSSLVVPSPIASLVATSKTTISVDEDKLIEVGMQLELHGSILHDHTHR
ncbi:hypothetical protein Tco_1139730, partial [Tanacetum coccineum]